MPDYRANTAWKSFWHSDSSGHKSTDRKRCVTLLTTENFRIFAFYYAQVAWKGGHQVGWKWREKTIVLQSSSNRKCFADVKNEWWMHNTRKDLGKVPNVIFLLCALNVQLLFSRLISTTEGLWSLKTFMKHSQTPGITVPTMIFPSIIDYTIIEMFSRAVQFQRKWSSTILDT